MVVRRFSIKQLNLKNADQQLKKVGNNSYVFSEHCTPILFLKFAHQTPYSTTRPCF